jgi:glycosyltransferase involved in cell wall biosynthesis
MAHPISVTILVKNGQKHIERCLTSLREFDEVIVLDNESTDRTVEVAAAFPNVKIFTSEFLGIGKLKNLAAQHATHDWIFNIDCDEVLTRDAVEEIQQLTLKESCIYSLPRKNFYREKHIKCCGWHPDRVLRLYNRRHASYNDCLVHASIVSGGACQIIPLNHAIEHFSFHSASDFLDKTQSYARLFAVENKGRRKSSPLKAVSHACFSFLKNYFLQKGFLYGYVGLLISVSNANGVFYKYMMLYEEDLK